MFAPDDGVFFQGWDAAAAAAPCEWRALNGWAAVSPAADVHLLVERLEGANLEHKSKPTVNKREWWSKQWRDSHVHLHLLKPGGR